MRASAGSGLTLGALRIAERPRGRRLIRAECAACGVVSHMLTVEYAARLSGLSLRELFRHVEGGRLHYAERPGESFVCLASLCALTPQTRELADSRHAPGRTDAD